MNFQIVAITNALTCSPERESLEVCEKSPDRHKSSEHTFPYTSQRNHLIASPFLTGSSSYPSSIDLPQLVRNSYATSSDGRAIKRWKAHDSPYWKAFPRAYTKYIQDSGVITTGRSRTHTHTRGRARRKGANARTPSCTNGGIDSPLVFGVGRQCYDAVASERIRRKFTTGEMNGGKKSEST